MTDEKLLALLKAIDPLAVRVPSGMRAIADAIESAERERCALLCEELDNSQNTNEYRTAARWAAVRIRGAQLGLSRPCKLCAQTQKSPHAAGQ